MSRTNPFPTREPFRPTQHEVDMLNYMTTQLSIKSPYKRFPPSGVPCPTGPNTFQLSIRREEWWEMLEELAWRERMMLQREPVRQEDREPQPWVQAECHKERKDSAGIIVVGKGVAATPNKSEVCEDAGSAAAAAAAAASAIYDSSEDEEEVPEQSQQEKEKEKNQSEKVKAKKKKEPVKDTDKPHKHEHKIRRLRPSQCRRSCGTA